MGIQILTQTLSSAEIASLSLLRTSHYCKSSHPKQGHNKSNLHILTATRVSQIMSSKESAIFVINIAHMAHVICYLLGIVKIKEKLVIVLFGPEM